MSTTSTETDIHATEVAPGETVKVAGPITREAQAMSTVKKYMAGNAAAGLVVLPIFDMVAITGLQMSMVSSISHTYGQKFQPDMVKSLLMGYLSSVGAMTIGYGVFRGMLKLVPGIGITAGAVAQSASAAAMTYAVGRAFIMHYEAGGTIMDLNPAEMKAHFKRLYAEGMEVARQEATLSTPPSVDAKTKITATRVETKTV